ncbi:MAG: relaxase [Bacteroidetes bacterium]|nr:MAG: relaxase [Bacteroidota bacterium]
MVAIINSGKSIAKALSYNEHKVKECIAECLAAINFIKDVDRLSFYDKEWHFKRLTSLNERTQLNILHVSLNFDPSEKLSNEVMVEIAKDYMNKIGFGAQPFLVYRHHDTAHPHMHIVTTIIKPDGKAIAIHRIGKNFSENARKEIEIKYGLKKAETKNLAKEFELKPVNAQKIKYGKSETMRAITNVLLAVVNHYRYSSLPELNAVLSLYNVNAFGGQEGSRLFKFRGLQYRVLDEKGHTVGVPINSSKIYFKPTLNYLEKKFSENKEFLHDDHKKKIRTTIDLAIRSKRVEFPELINYLAKEGISTVFRQNSEGFEITFVDHQTKCVFNGSDLGKDYGAGALKNRCSIQNEPLKVKEEIHEHRQSVISNPGESYLIKERPIETGI